jgi:hypothetical protein
MLIDVPSFFVEWSVFEKSDEVQFDLYVSKSSESPPPPPSPMVSFTVTEMMEAIKNPLL